MRSYYAKKLNATPSMDEKIQLYSMTEDVLWRDLDRYMRVIKYFIYLFTSTESNNVKGGIMPTQVTLQPPNTAFTLHSAQSGP